MHGLSPKLKNDQKNEIPEGSKMLWQRLGKRRIYRNLIVQVNSRQEWIEKMKINYLDSDTKEYVHMLENTLPALQWVLIFNTLRFII